MAQKRAKKSNPAGALVAVLMLILVAVAVVVVVRSFTGGEGGQTPAPPATSEQQTPSQPQESETPRPTESPTPTPKPTETPEQTPEPTPEPVVDASGSFKSGTGAGLELKVDWTAASIGDGKMRVTVALSAESYSLRCSGTWHGATVTVAGQEQSLDTLDISYDGPGQGTNPLGSVSFTVDAADRVDISAAWRFAGTYGGKELETLTASATALIA